MFANNKTSIHIVWHLICTQAAVDYKGSILVMLNANAKEQTKHNLINLCMQKQSLLICLSFIFFMNCIYFILFVLLFKYWFTDVPIILYAKYSLLNLYYFFFSFYVHYLYVKSCRVPRMPVGGDSALESMFADPQIREEEKSEKKKKQRAACSAVTHLAELF